jgi:threonine/homoserine/homoserine lactone efflux protein
VPQFVSADTSAMLPLAMVITMGTMVFAWLAAYARLASRLSRALTRRGTSRAINGTVGAVLVGLGARLGVAYP